MSPSPKASFAEMVLAMAAHIPGIDLDAVRTGLAMRHNVKEIQSAIHAHFARYDLSPARFTVLVLLMHAQEEGLNPAELAEEVDVSRASMTGLLDVLEHAGLITRAQHPSDRRMVAIQITDKGRQTVLDMLPDHFRRISRVVGQLTPDERRTLVSLMTKLAAGAAALRQD